MRIYSEIATHPLQNEKKKFDQKIKIAVQINWKKIEFILFFSRIKQMSIFI